MQYFLQLQDNTNIIFGFADNSAEIPVLPGFSVVQYSTNEVGFNPIGKVFENGNIVVNIEDLRALTREALKSDLNASKKITIQNGTTLIIEHDTPERKYFVDLIEKVSNLSLTNGAFIYKQKTNSGTLALRILPEIATYIFKDLFVATLNNPQQTDVNSRIHNKTTVYDLALEQIDGATTQLELDAITWNFLHPTGIVIDVNAEANKMLADATVSAIAKLAINAAKDPVTNEIHLVKTLPELAANS